MQNFAHKIYKIMSLVMAYRFNKRLLLEIEIKALSVIPNSNSLLLMCWHDIDINSTHMNWVLMKFIEIEKKKKK